MEQAKTACRDLLVSQQLDGNTHLTYIGVLQRVGIEFYNNAGKQKETELVEAISH